MKKYVLNWSETESFVPALADNTAKKEFDNLADAEKAFDDELENTDMKAVSELNYSPTEKECRQHETELCIIYLSDDDDVEVIKNSESYWCE